MSVWISPQSEGFSKVPAERIPQESQHSITKRDLKKSSQLEERTVNRKSGHEGVVSQPCGGGCQT